MKFPTRVKLFNKVYKIVYVAPKYVKEAWERTEKKKDDDRLDGFCSNSEQLIYIDKNLPLASKKECLLHELLHAVECSLGFDLKDEQIQGMAVGILDLIIKNKLSFL